MVRSRVGEGCTWHSGEAKRCQEGGGGLGHLGSPLASPLQAACQPWSPSTPSPHCPCPAACAFPAKVGVWASVLPLLPSHCGQRHSLTSRACGLVSRLTCGTPVNGGLTSGTPVSSGLRWGMSNTGTAACEWSQPTSVIRLCSCLPHPYNPAKPDTPSAPLGLCSGLASYQKCLLLSSWQTLVSCSVKPL